MIILWMDFMGGECLFRKIFLMLMLAGASVITGASQQLQSDVISSLVHSVASGGNAVSESDESIKSINGDDKVWDVLNELSSLGALDFLSDVYESADFYASGKWSDDGKTYSSFDFTGELPDYDMSDFIRPVIGGKLTSGYGYRESYRRVHRGVDISLKVGDAVRASLPGVVGRIGYEPGGYGHFVILVHGGGVETRYAHLSRVTAVLGEEVVAGQGIAIGGNTGNSTGPHLHFEVRKHGVAIDPLLLFEL